MVGDTPELQDTPEWQEPARVSHETLKSMFRYTRIGHLHLKQVALLLNTEQQCWSNHDGQSKVLMDSDLTTWVTLYTTRHFVWH